MRGRIRQRPTRTGALLAAVLATSLLSACGADEPARASVVRVPADAPGLNQALDQVAENGLVLVEAGVYREAVTVDVPGVTLRGTDRNAVIVDGEGLRPNGIVVTAPGVTVQNLTVRNHTFYGLLVTGMPEGGNGSPGSAYTRLDPEKFPPVQRFRVDHVTAANNGLYGIYAFDAQHGVIENSYASGSADSGFYVGQCRECDIVVRGNVAERNAVGFENANASDSVYVLGNRWSDNRIGMTFLSTYQEAFHPQHGNVVRGNLVSHNVSADSPAHASGGFGIGVGISGGQDNLIEANRIVGHPRTGLQFTHAEDIPATGNRVLENSWQDNGVDVADRSSDRTPSSGNCVVPGPSVLPDTLAVAACPTGSVAGPGVGEDALPPVEIPPGTDFLKVPAPRPQPSLSGPLDQPGPPLPATVGVPDLTPYGVPADDFLADRTGTA